MKTIEYGNPDAAAVLLQAVDDHDLSGIENEVRSIRENTRKDFRLITFRVDDWNRDLSPWEAPPVFGKEGFGGGAALTLEALLSYCTDPNKTYYIGGYSLGGLFALWAAFQTDRFTGVAAASPSVWFPGFLDYAKAHTLQCNTAYLSLGDREEKTKNPVVATVGTCIRNLYAHLKSEGKHCVLEWNEGNHFKNADLRTALAFAWVLNHTSMP